MKRPDFTGDGNTGYRLGCLLVMLPVLAFAFVMPDAIHVWEPPFANPLLWIAVGTLIWLGLRRAIDASIEALPPTMRRLLWGLMILVSAALAVLIVKLV